MVAGVLDGRCASHPLTEVVRSSCLPAAEGQSHVSGSGRMAGGQMDLPSLAGMPTRSGAVSGLTIRGSDNLTYEYDSAMLTVKLKLAYLLIIHCVMFGIVFLEAGEGYSLSGRYTLSTYNDETQEIMYEYHAKFAFGRSGDCLRIEILDHGYFPVYRRMKWLYCNGVTYHSLYSDTNKIEKIEGNLVADCVLDIKDGYILPGFGWHLALPIIMVYAPEYVVEESPNSDPTVPPTVPIDIFTTQRSNLPERVICNYSLLNENVPDSALSMLESFRETRIAYTSFPDQPNQPRIYVPGFSCKVSQYENFNDSYVPTEFEFVSFSTDMRNTTRSLIWSVSASVDISSLDGDSGVDVIVDQKTYVIDFRDQDSSFDTISYKVDSDADILIPGSEGWDREISSHTYHEKISVKRMGIVALFVVLTASVFFVVRHIRRSLKRNVRR